MFPVGQRKSLYDWDSYLIECSIWKSFEGLWICFVLRARRNGARLKKMFEITILRVGVGWE